MHPALLGLVTIIMGVGGCVGYFWLSNIVLDKFLFPARGPNAGRNINRANIIRPWLFLFPALFALSIYLAYPVVETIPARANDTYDKAHGLFRRLYEQTKDIAAELT